MYMDEYLGMIMPVAFNFVPRGWAACNGQLLSISQNSALFALLGTTYGGNGQTTFALPDLRGRTLVGMGQGTGLSPVNMGDLVGSNTTTVAASGNAMVSIDATHLPKHSHPVSIAGAGLTATSTLHATASGPGAAAPTEGAALGTTGGGPGSAAIYVGNATTGVALNAGSVTTKLAGQVDTNTGENTGGGAPIAVPVSTTATASVMQPSLGINYVICIEGIFPSRE
jgi:microcystin-dependent protein